MHAETNTKIQYGSFLNKVMKMKTVVAHFRGKGLQRRYEQYNFKQFIVNFRHSALSESQRDTAEQHRLLKILQASGDLILLCDRHRLLLTGQVPDEQTPYLKTESLMS